MEHTITLTIPSDWLEGQLVDQDQLRQALMLGLAQLRQRQAALDAAAQVVQVLLTTDRIHHLSAELVEGDGTDVERQVPPVLPGPPVSEILIAQRRGEL
jgi:predicted RNA-binding protein associated with RNAse of E/G family